MKKYLSVVLSFIMIISLSGCALVPSVELTESEQKVIAEYAAGLLLKYDKNYGGSLKDLEDETDDGIGFVENEEAKTPGIEEEPLAEDNTTFNQPDFSEDLSVGDTQPEESASVEYSDISIAQAIGLDGFEIIYKSSEVHDIYPEEESGDLVFSLQAQNGMELLVLNFTVTNDSGERRLCDVLDSGVSFRLLINGSERVNANKTILLNDLGSYSEEIEGYGMVDTCLVFELSEGTSSAINSLDLIVKNGDESTIHSLK
ncbi:MAG: hypothetical protein Q4D29_05980 [Lachnospiraceae bacterium]|nr:hypothetical protein [Lachnospiraceae bacterium]